MTYDHWKSTEPDYDDGTMGDCDCCSKYRPLSRCWAYGIETWACDECRGFEESEPRTEEDLDQEDEEQQR